MAMETCRRITVWLLLAAGGLGAAGMASETDPAREPGSHSRPLAPDVAAALSARAPDPGMLYLTTERVRLTDGEYTSAHRGRLFVPLQRDRTDSAVVSVEIYRFPATSAEAATRPPIFVLPGGPGFPGMAQRLQEGRYHQRYIAPLRRIADVVVIGQRGFGSSRPDTRCRPPRAVGSGISAEQGAGERRAAVRRCLDFWRDHGVDLAGFNVLEAAADVDAARRALGYERIVLHGFSFGSHWAMAVMRRYPETIARALLTGVEGPDQTYDLPGDKLATLRRIAADAERAPALAAELTGEGLVTMLEAAIARLRADPVVVSIDHPETGESVAVRFDASDRSRLAMGYTDPPAGQHAMAAWPRDILALARGDYTAAARARVVQRLEPPSVPRAAFYAFDCSSGISPERARRLDAEAADIVGKPGAADYLSICPLWERDLGDAFRRSFTSEIPTLLVQGTWDLATPLENALALLPAFDEGTLVRVERGTHSAYWQAREASPRFRADVDRFLRTGERAQLPATVTLSAVDWLAPRP